MTVLAIILIIVTTTVIDHPARFGSWLHFVKRGYDAGSDRARVRMEDQKYHDATKGLGVMSYILIILVVLAIVAFVAWVV